MRTLATFIINFFRNLEVNQRHAIIQGAFIQAKQPYFSRNWEICGILIVLFLLLSSSLLWIAFSPWGNVKSNDIAFVYYCIFLILQLLEMMIITETTKKLTKALKGKTGNWYAHWSFPKLRYYPGNLEDHIHVQGGVYIQERHEMLDSIISISIYEK